LERLIRIEAHSGNQDDRLSDLELRSKESDIKIDVLEAKISKIVEKDPCTKFDTDLAITGSREKRPARLLPISFLYG